MNLKKIVLGACGSLLRRKPAGVGSTFARGTPLVFEPLETRLLLDGNLLITELMAIKDSAFVDENGEPSDWIEIHNPTGAAVNLEGWHLKDRANWWEFPAYELDPGEYLVVFASEKDRTDPAGQLHTNFKLDGDGEYLALVEPDGTVAFEYAPQFPPQYEGVSYGIASAAETTTVLSSGAEVRALVPADDSLADAWTDPLFDDAGWGAGMTGVGYETGAGYQAEIDHDVQADMFGVNTSAYLRVPFDVADPAAVDQLTLRMKYDDGFVAYLNGQQVAYRNAPTVSGGSPESGLVGYWDFEGNLLDDAAEYTNNSGLADDDFTVRAGGAPRYAPGISGQAVALDAAPGDALSLSAGDSLDVRLGSVYTVEMWIYPTNLYSWSRLALNWAGAGNSYHFALRNGNQVSLFHAQADGSNRNIDSAGIVQLGAAGGWQHIAGIADGSRLQVYHNGVNVGSTTYDGTIRTVAQGLGLADSPQGGSGSSLRYQGYLDELAVWNVALSDEQILSHYQAGELGYGLGGAGAPDPLAWNAAATRSHPDNEALQFEAIDVTPHLDALRPGGNVLAVHGLNVAAGDPDFLIVPELDTGRLSPQPELLRYFAVPTPAGPNGTGVVDLGPAIGDVPDTLPQAPEDNDILITAAVAETNHPLASVSLHYRVMFGAETAVPMFDDGLHGDGLSGDGLFGAAIPAAASDPGEMVRWYVTAEDVAGYESRWPLFEDPLGSAQYAGTIVDDPSIDTALPVFHRFIQNASAAETGAGTRASVFYGGEFYDNVFVRIRGGTARNWPKKSYKFKFNPGHGFRFDADEDRVDEINVNATYTDKSYVRSVLAYETHRDAGTPAPETFLIRMQQNGGFFSVALFVEQPQKVFLRRHRLDDDGALYKATQTTNGLTGSATRGIDKKFPKDGDFSDLQALINGLALSGTAQENFVFDNVNLPAQISFMAAGVIMQNIDATDKNYFIYRDTFGTGEWQMIPWDLDLTFGPNALNTDRIEADEDAPPDHASYPFLGGLQFPFHGRKNHLFDAIFVNGRTREMFLRRLRTLMDQLLDPGQQQFENRIDELKALLGPDVLLDKARWGGSAHFGSTDYTLSQATDRIKNEYLGPRRTHLFGNHSVNNPGYPNNAGIPDAQSGNPAINFGSLVYNPASGNQDEEYIELLNPHPFAVDISGWQLGGGVQTTFAPGTVIPAGETLYVSPDVTAFRSRATAPTGGMGLFVQGYDGHLSSFGETITLTATGGEVISEITYPGDPSPQQLYLRITEVNYNPHDADTTLGELDVDNEQFEFIELVNTSVDVTLDLSGVKLTGDTTFDFGAAGPGVLAAGQYMLVVRNQPAFESRYGAGLNVAGEFPDGLDDAGERIKLEDATNSTIVQFDYDNGGAWPGRANGKGATLEVIDLAADYGSAENWHSSVRYGGTPGTGGEDEIGIVVNEVLTHTDWPSLDTIELYNAADQPIDIAGWYLSDSWGWASNLNNGNYKKYRIPVLDLGEQGKTLLGPGEYIVFDESHFNSTGLDADPNNDDPNDFALDGAHGDDVWLMKTDASGNLTHFVDHVDFGGAKNGESFGRWPNGTGDLYPMIGQTLGRDNANTGPRIGPLVISELMYNPPDPDGPGGIDPGDLEFVELYNPTAQTIELAELLDNPRQPGTQYLADWRLRKGVDMEFDPGDAIGPLGTLVALSFNPDKPENAARVAAFRNFYGIDASVALAGGYGGSLDNAGERVQLQRPDEPPLEEPDFVPHYIEDEIDYDDLAPWPVSADGSGDSLHRLGTNLWGNDPASWEAAVPSPGAVDPALTPQVTGRYVFYHNSAFSADAAVAPTPQQLLDGGKDPKWGKRALRPGEIATFQNYTTYSRGLNGIVVDITNLPAATAQLTTDDFQFRVGNSSDLATWSDPAATPAPQNIALDTSASGPARATITWPNNAIGNQWLQVTVKATSGTGLTSDDVFYFGNTAGEVGNTFGEADPNALVTYADLIQTRNNIALTTEVTIENGFDFNRDKFVTYSDLILCRNNINLTSGLNLIAAPAAAAPPAALLAAESAGVHADRPSAELTNTLAISRTERVSFGELAWLVNYERLIAGKRTSGKQDRVDAAVDELLATWP